MAMNQLSAPRFFVDAQYSPQRIPQFSGNPLIEALPAPLSDQGLLEALTLMPDFHASQRDWSTSERLMMLESLQNFMMPLPRHMELCRALDSMLRAGYVGRAPNTEGRSQIYQKIYIMQKEGKSFTQTSSSRTPQLSTSLIGLSGMGKTTTVQRWSASLPTVIYHRDFNLYQIPVLHVEMPSDGSSIKGLAQGILQKIDELIPGQNYFDMYAQRGRVGADALMRSVARVMNLHLVGLLICDEVQNLSNATKGGQTVMTELVSAANDLKVPILFIGTNKAARVLSADFRQSRRSSGHGIAPWERLLPGDASQRSEWDVFLDVLWQFQWVRNPAELDATFEHYMFDLSQGVIDVAIKLFAAAQARAISDGSETLSVDLLIDVYEKEFQLLHPMLKALRDDNYTELCRYDDIAPINLKQHLNDAQRRLELRKSPLFSTTAKDPGFTERLSTGLVALGVDQKKADDLAQTVADSNGQATLAQGIQVLAKELKHPKQVKTRSKNVVVPLDPKRFDSDPRDYRRASAHAQPGKVSAFQRLVEFGMAPTLDEVVEL